MKPEFNKETAWRYKKLIPDEKKTEWGMLLGFISQGIYSKKLSSEAALEFADFLSKASGYSSGVQDIMPYLMKDWEQITADWIQRKLEKEGFNE